MRLTRRPLLIEADWRNRQGERRAIQGGPSDVVQHAISRIRTGESPFALGEDIRRQHGREAHDQYKQALGANHPYTRAHNHLQQSVIDYQLASASRRHRDLPAPPNTALHAAAYYLAAHDRAGRYSNFNDLHPMTRAHAARLAVEHLLPNSELRRVPLSAGVRHRVDPKRIVDDPKSEIQRIATLLGGNVLGHGRRVVHVTSIGHYDPLWQLAGASSHFPTEASDHLAQTFRDAITRLRTGSITRHRSHRHNNDDDQRLHDFSVALRQSPSDQYTPRPHEPEQRL